MTSATSRASWEQKTTVSHTGVRMVMVIFIAKSSHCRPLIEHVTHMFLNYIIQSYMHIESVSFGKVEKVKLVSFYFQVAITTSIE